MPPTPAALLGRPHVREAALLAALAGSAALAFALAPDRDLTVSAMAVASLPLFVLPWRRRAPLLAFLGVEAAAVGSRVAFGPNGPTDLMVLVALYALATRRGASWGLAAVAVDVLLLAAAAVASPSGATDLGVEVVGQLVVDVLVVLFALWQAARRDHVRDLAGRADRLARLQELEAAAAVDRERRRLAHELHDVVAHHVSVMTLQAGAVQRNLRALDAPEELMTTTAELRATGHEAMQELRRLLDILRTEGGGDTHQPNPGLGDVRALAARVREAGLAVDVALAGDLGQPSAGVQLAAYRIVQEALTNALRHAGAERVVVAVTVEGGRVELEVRDLGGTRHPPRHPRSVPPPGHGITGMRERAQLYGGTVTAGPHPDGGWCVHAELPSPTVAVERSIGWGGPEGQSGPRDVSRTSAG